MSNLNQDFDELKNGYDRTAGKDPQALKKSDFQFKDSPNRISNQAQFNELSKSQQKEERQVSKDNTKKMGHTVEKGWMGLNEGLGAAAGHIAGGLAAPGAAVIGGVDAAVHGKSVTKGAAKAVGTTVGAAKHAGQTVGHYGAFGLGAPAVAAYDGIKKVHEQRENKLNNEAAAEAKKSAERAKHESQHGSHLLQPKKRAEQQPVVANDNGVQPQAMQGQAAQPMPMANYQQQGGLMAPGGQAMAGGALMSTLLGTSQGQPGAVPGMNGQGNDVTGFLNQLQGSLQQGSQGTEQEMQHDIAKQGGAGKGDASAQASGSEPQMG